MATQRAEVVTLLRRLVPVAGGAISDVDRVILEAATGARRLSFEELRLVLEHVAQAGFPPGANSEAHGLSGIEWQGRILRRRDRITSAERHYLDHVVVNREWPDGTTLDEYLESIRAVILDPSSGVFTSRYLQAGQQWRWQLGVVNRTGELRGPRGADWILVDYRVGVGWTTAYQPQQRLQALVDPRREEMRWLRPLPR